MTETLAWRAAWPATAVPAEPCVLDSFVAGIGEAADPGDLVRLLAGAPLRLRAGERPRGRHCIEVLTEEGRLLGWLPHDDVLELEAVQADMVKESQQISADLDRMKNIQSSLK